MLTVLLDPLRRRPAARTNPAVVVSGSSELHTRITQYSLALTPRDPLVTTRSRGEMVLSDRIIAHAARHKCAGLQ